MLSIMRAMFVAILLAALAGCSWFSTPKLWTKPNVTLEQADADLDACKRIAREQEATDENIDQDTAATMGDSTGAVDTELSDNMSSQRSGERYDDIVASCMRELGYHPAR
jgi:hypothetical protein